jgi:hypothetical protein
MVMNRLLRILLLAVLLGPQVGTFLAPPEVFCEETSDCCTPDGVCDVDCVVCAFCVSRIPSLTPSISVESIGAHPGATNTAASAAPLPLHPKDILHVPKSL